MLLPLLLPLLLSPLVLLVLLVLLPLLLLLMQKLRSLVSPSMVLEVGQRLLSNTPVSYTHLTLPTILLV